MVISQLSMGINGYQGLLMVIKGYWLSTSCQWLSRVMVISLLSMVINSYQGLYNY